MKFSRGLAALILTLFFHTQLVAQYLYKDEVIFNPKFNEEINKLGSELYTKTGISLYLVMLKELAKDETIFEYEEKLLKNFNEPTVLLIFSQLNTKVDIAVNDDSLYKYFDKKQILSPAASTVQSYLLAMIYAKSWDEFNAMRVDNGGTILPLLGERDKKGELLGKYSGAMFNGYFDLAEQIAQNNATPLDGAVGNSSSYSFLAVKIFFYGFVLYGAIMIIRRKMYQRRQKNEL